MTPTPDFRDRLDWKMVVKVMLYSLFALSAVAAYAFATFYLWVKFVKWCVGLPW